MASWQLLVAAFLAIGIAASVLVLWQRRGRSAAVRRVGDVLAVHGAARCGAAVALFRRLAASGDQAAIIAASEALELPLLQALPDCPPDCKAPLADALDACARITVKREAAKRLVGLRNALIS